MILFYNKQTGEIIGHINGRIHEEHHLNSFMGEDPNQYGKIVCQWKVVREWRDEHISTDFPLGHLRQDWEPDNTQKDLFILFDQSPSKVFGYEVDLNTGQLVKKSL